MKKYNIQNYIRYKNDVKNSQPKEKHWRDYTRDELIIKFLPLVENIAKSFSTSDQASGVMDITDLIQEGNLGLIKAVDKLDIEFVLLKTDPEKSIKSFLSKRIKGAIRRAIDINRAGMRIPEHKLNEIRNSDEEDDVKLKMFFNSIFKSIDDEDSDYYSNIPDSNKEYKTDMFNTFLLSLMKSVLNKNEYDVLRLSYGLDCRKHSAKQIAFIVGISGSSAHVRVSQIKKQAIDKLSSNIKLSQVIDFIQ